jgi:DNA-binding HxlR family transcriptional regulator
MYDAVRAVVEPKWSLEILATLSEESPQNFSAVEEQFDTSSDVIANRLRLLVDYGLVERTEHSRRDVRYGITDRGGWFLQRIVELDGRLSSG